MQINRVSDPGWACFALLFPRFLLDASRFAPFPEFKLGPGQGACSTSSPPRTRTSGARAWSLGDRKYVVANSP